MFMSASAWEDNMLQDQLLCGMKATQITQSRMISTAGMVPDWSTQLLLNDTSDDNIGHQLSMTQCSTSDR